MELFGSLNLTWIDGLIVGLIVAFVEFVIKMLICKSDPKYKAIYTYTPIVLAAVVYLVIALIQKTPWLTGLGRGVLIGLGTMGSYDAIILIIKKVWQLIKTKGLASVKEIGDEIAKTVEKK